MGKAQLGTPVDAGPKTWVQTERAAHEAWGKLAMKSPIASAVLHRLIAIMGHQNAVVIGQKTLAKLLGCNARSIARAIEILESEKWVQVVQIGQRGTVNAYVVNDRVAWGEKREHLPRLSVFSAAIVADEEDQPEYTLLPGQLRRIPALYPGEQQLPTGPGLPPPSEPSLPGLEPDLPARQMDIEELTK
jgi:hypothetical protein